ncbi:MAG: DUF3443 domain-containing protein [Steroidobacterales bacterium]
MSQRFRWIVLLGVCALAGCGGGQTPASTSSSSSSSGSSSGATVANVVPVAVDAGPAAAAGGTFNIPYASVQLCRPGTSTCATIDNVLVDTGSYGLRIMASALQAAGLSLTTMADPATAGNSIAECLPFADGYTWGPVARVDVSMAGEAASSVSINIIDDTSSYPATAPSSCKNLNSSTSLNSVSAFAANGVLGIGVFDQDCGPSCANCASVTGGCTGTNDIYYSCNTGTNTCNVTPVALTAQVRNPVALFASDNNGVILQLPSVPAAGQTTASGTLTFGIGTQSDNALGSATVFTTDNAGNFTTMFNTQTLASFIDSGSNGLYFPDSSITICTNTPSNPTASDFYCPSSPQMLQATNQGQNGSSNSVSFQITSLNSLNNSFYAAPTVGGPASATPGLGSSFDWGLPFFYGQSVYTAIEGKTAGSATGPYYAY